MNLEGMTTEQAKQFKAQVENGSIAKAWLDVTEETCTRMETRKCPAICIWIGEPETKCARFSFPDQVCLDLTDEYWKDIKK
jgi:hypothetical protein